jgi:hypothetical protein
MSSPSWPATPLAGHGVASTRTKFRRRRRTLETTAPSSRGGFGHADRSHEQACPWFEPSRIHETGEVTVVSHSDDRIDEQLIGDGGGQEEQDNAFQTIRPKPA